MRPADLFCAAMMLVAALGGCIGDTTSDDGADSGRCEHPFPCDDEAWPVGLTGPFDLLERAEVTIPSHDGVVLHGWLWRPDLPASVGAPTILMSTPYLGSADGQDQMETSYEPPILRTYGPHGYAYLVMEVRGTGGSGGCFGHHDLAAQKDPAALVAWIAQQPWSNGRVGMAGISYMGVTAIHGAIHAGPALKAIAPVAVPQQYLYHFTPQGAFSTSAAGYEATQHTVKTPPIALDMGPEAALSSLALAPERWCEEYARNMAVEPRAMIQDDRDAAFWEVRDAFRSYPDITAAVFLTEGFDDPYVPWGQEVAWDLLQGPKRILFGQWGHEMPPLETTGRDRLAWFDFWLKGEGAPPRIGVVDFQDDGGIWHESAAWPPREASEETLYFVEAGLAVTPSAGRSSYQSAPAWPEATPRDRLCAGENGLSFETRPIEGTVVVAGNPMAWLSLESDGPSGLVGLYLYRIPHDGTCADASLLTWGAADLRFHGGNMVGEDFPTGRPASVRIDLEPLAARLDAGDRIAAVLTHPGPYESRDLEDPERLLPDGPGSAGRTGQPAYPRITLHATDGLDSSHVRLPVIEGAMGGNVVDLAYPPRPFSGR